MGAGASGPRDFSTTQLPATSGTPPTEAACSSVRRGGPLGLCPLSVQLRCPSHADLPQAPLSALTGPGLMGTPAEALLPRAEVTSQGSRGWTCSGVLPALPHSSSTLLCPAWVPGAGLSGFANGSPAPQHPLASAGRKCCVEMQVPDGQAGVFCALPGLRAAVRAGASPPVDLGWHQLPTGRDARRLKAPPLTPAEYVSRGPSSLLREQR